MFHFRFNRDNIGFWYQNYEKMLSAKVRRLQKAISGVIGRILRDEFSNFLEFFVLAALNQVRHVLRFLPKVQNQRAGVPKTKFFNRFWAHFSASSRKFRLNWFSSKLISFWKKRSFQTQRQKIKEETKFLAKIQLFHYHKGLWNKKWEFEIFQKKS